MGDAGSSSSTSGPAPLVHRAASTPNLSNLVLGTGGTPMIAPPPSTTSPANSEDSGGGTAASAAAPGLQVWVTGASMVVAPQSEGDNEDLVTLFEISVRVGQQELVGARRRYREFHKLLHALQQNYPHLLSDDAQSEGDREQHGAGRDGAGGRSASDNVAASPGDAKRARPIPPFPRKHLFRASWDPVVVVERVEQLGAWLTAVTEKLQFASLELVSFLNIPLYAAIRLLSGDLQPADFAEPMSPDSVMEEGVKTALERDAPFRLDAPLSGSSAGRKFVRSPEVDRRSLDSLASVLPRSVHRPGYQESVLFVARAIAHHAAAAAVSNSPAVEDALAFVRVICSRALFKPCCLIATVVYMERLRKTELHALLHTDGWQVTLLTLLVIAAKVWDSDYPIINADICQYSPSAAVGGQGAGASGGVGGGAKPGGHGGGGGDRTYHRPVSARRVNDCERRVLQMLDYCTNINPAQFAKYYLTLPWAFTDGRATMPTSPASSTVSSVSSAAAADAAAAASAAVPAGGADEEEEADVVGGAEGWDPTRKAEHEAADAAAAAVPAAVAHGDVAEGKDDVERLSFVRREQEQTQDGESAKRPPALPARRRRELRRTHDGVFDEGTSALAGADGPFDGVVHINCEVAA